MTDADGEFITQLPNAHQILEIVEIRKEGYAWVFDLMTKGPHEGPKSQSNTYYEFAGPVRVQRAYLFEYDAPAEQPGIHNPAIYPMRLAGSSKPVGNASRGGADRDASGRVKVNGPVAILLPSAGPGSPGEDPVAIGDAIRAFPYEKIKDWMQKHDVDDS